MFLSTNSKKQENRETAFDIQLSSSLETGFCSIAIKFLIIPALPLLSFMNILDSYSAVLICCTEFFLMSIYLFLQYAYVV